MWSAVGFTIMSMLWCIYIRGAYGEHNNTTRTRAVTYGTRNEAAHKDSDDFKKYKQEHSRRTGSNESRQENGRQTPIPAKEESRLMWKILLVLTMILTYLTCIKCCSMVEPQEIVIEVWEIRRYEGSAGRYQASLKGGINSCRLSKGGLREMLKVKQS